MAIEIIVLVLALRVKRLKGLKQLKGLTTSALRSEGESLVNLSTFLTSSTFAGAVTQNIRDPAITKMNCDDDYD